MAGQMLTALPEGCIASSQERGTTERSAADTEATDGDDGYSEWWSGGQRVREAFRSGVVGMTDTMPSGSIHTA